MADIDATLGQQILDVAQRQRVSHVHRHDQTDDLRRAIEIAEWVAHGLKLPRRDAAGFLSDSTDHSTFSKNRHGRFRESDLLRKLFETVVARCIKERIVGGEAFAVDASIIVADAHRRRSVAKVEDLVPTSSRAVAEYLSVLDDAAFSGATRSSQR